MVSIRASLRATVTINCRHPCLIITEDIINSRRETTASARRCGITHSGRCCANDPRKSRTPSPCDTGFVENVETRRGLGRALCDQCF
jgi:hypothetical protein